MEAKRVCDVENPSDFYKYYEAGWISLEDKSPYTPLQVVGVLDSWKAFTFNAIKLEENGNLTYLPQVSHTWDEIVSKANFGVPEVGMLNNFELLTYGAQLATRQSSRGLRLGSIFFHEFNDWYTRTKNGDDEPPTSNGRLDLIWDIFNPKWFSLREAFSLLEKGKRAGVPMTRYLGLYSLPNKRFPALAYKRWTIGYAPDPWSIVLGKRYADFEDMVRYKLQVNVTLI